MRVVLILLVTLCASSPVHAQIPLDCAMLGISIERGITRDIVVRENLAWLADGRGVAVYEVNNPQSIRKVTSMPATRESKRIAVSGSDALLLTSGRIEIFSLAGRKLEPRGFVEVPGLVDIEASERFAVTAGSELALWKTSPGAIEVLDRLPSSANAILLAGDSLFVASPTGTISIYHVGSGRLELLSSFAGSALGFAFGGDILYAVDGTGGLYIADVSDRTAPRLIGFAGRTIRNLQNVALAGNLLFASHAGTEIDVYDVSDSSAPRLARNFGESSDALATDGTFLYVAGSTRDHWGNLSPTGKPLRIFRAEAETPLAGELVTTDGPVTGVATDGRYAYVSDFPFFRVIDLANPRRPAEIARLTIDDPAERVGLHGTLAYLHSRGNVHLIDISNPRSPRKAGVFLARGVPPSGAGFAGDYLIEANFGSGLHVVDVSDPGNPTQIAGLKFDSLGQFSTAFGRPGVAYGVLPTGVRVADISDPHLAKHIRVADIPGVLDAVVAAATENRPETLVVQRRELLSFYDMTDPLLPVEIASLPSPGGIDVETSDNIAYVAASNGELTRVDFSDPGNPIVTQRLAGLIAPGQVAIGDGVVVVADRYSLRVLLDLPAVTSDAGCRFTPPPSRGRLARRP